MRLSLCLFPALSGAVAVVAPLSVVAQDTLPSGVNAVFPAKTAQQVTSGEYSDGQPPPSVAAQGAALRVLPTLFVSSPFGWRSHPLFHHIAMHTGVDLPSPAGTAVHAMAKGLVRRAGRASGYGLLVEIDHGEGIVTRYAHLSAIAVLPGANIEADSVIGRVGSTGVSTGNHLHFEVRDHGIAVEPLAYIKNYPDRANWAEIHRPQIFRSTFAQARDATAIAKHEPVIIGAIR